MTEQCLYLQINVWYASACYFVGMAVGAGLMYMQLKGKRDG